MRSNWVLRNVRTLSGAAALNLAVLLATGPAAAQTTTSVQPGPWLDPATWDSGVPTATDTAVVNHESTTFANDEQGIAASLIVGSGSSGLVDIVGRNSGLTIVGDVLLGDTGGPGRVKLDRDATITADRILIGNGSNGILRGESPLQGNAVADEIIVGNGSRGILSLFDVTVNSGPFRVGADGSLGVIHVGIDRGQRIIANNGFTLGAEGIIKLTELFRRPFLPPVNVAGGDLTFESGSIIDGSDIRMRDIVVGDRVEFLSYTGSLIGTPTFIPPSGFGAILDTSTPGLISIEITSIPDSYEWIANTPASFFDANNWDIGAIPTNGGNVFIRNGGEAVADGTDSGAPSELLLNELTVGDATGSGTLTLANLSLRTGVGDDIDVAANDERVTSGVISGVTGKMTFTDSPSLFVDSELSVALFRVGGSGQVTGTGELTLERIDDIHISSDLDVSAHSIASGDGCSASGSGSLTIRDVETLYVGGCFDVCDGNVGNSGGTGRATGNFDGSVLIERVGSVIVSAELDLGQNAADENETANTRFDLTWRDVDSIVIEGEIDYLTSGGHGMGAEAGVVDYDGTMTFERCSVLVTGEIEMCPVEMSGDGVVEAIGRMNLIDSSLLLDDSDEIVDIGAIDFAFNDPNGTMGSGAPGNSVEAYLNLTCSSFVTNTPLFLGQRRNGISGNLEAQIDLRKGSYLATERMEVGTEGTILTHLGGLSRARLETVGAEDTYSAIDVGDAILEGEIIADFDFLPPAGTHSFDLLVSANSTALDDTNATFEVRDLSSNFTIDFFGVVEEGGVDRIRLTITGSCGGGTVDTANGSAADVLLVNGSAGGASRTVTVGAGVPLTLELQAPPADPTQARYTLWIWGSSLEAPGVYDLALPFGGGFNEIGCTVGPTPFDNLDPQPIRCLRGSGIPPAFCAGIGELTSPDFAPFTRTGSVSQPKTFFLQAVIEDAGAGNPLGFSVTNSLTLVIE